MEVDELDVSQGRGYPNGYVQRCFDFAPPRTNRAAHVLCTKRGTGEHLLPFDGDVVELAQGAVRPCPLVRAVPVRKLTEA